MYQSHKKEKLDISNAVSVLVLNILLFFPLCPQLRISIMIITVPAFFKPQGHLSPFMVVEQSQLFTALITQRLGEFHATMVDY